MKIIRLAELNLPPTIKVIIEDTSKYNAFLELQDRKFISWFETSRQTFPNSVNLFFSGIIGRKGFISNAVPV